MRAGYGGATPAGGVQPAGVTDNGDGTFDA